MKLAHLTKPSDLLEYGIKDLEASGLNYNPAVWLRANECCVAGGVMHQTFGRRAAVGDELTPNWLATDCSDSDDTKMQFLSNLAFGHYYQVIHAMGFDAPADLPRPGIAHTIEELKARVDFLRLLGL